MANFMQNLKELNQLRQTAKVIEKKLREQKREFSSRDGKIKGIINGKLEILSLEVAPELLTVEGKAALERLLISTVNNAVSEMQNQVSKVVSSQMGINLPGLGL